MVASRTTLAAVVAVFCCLSAESARAMLVTGSVTSSTAANDYWPASRASDGSNAVQWVTESLSPTYYLGGGPVPVLTVDLGEDHRLAGFALWDYDLSHNGTIELSARFASDAEGPGGFGTSNTYNPLSTPIRICSTRPNRISPSASTSSLDTWR